ncbi:MAG: hypothetical protein AB8B49_02330 [Nitratireductor sp.]
MKKLIIIALIAATNFSATPAFSNNCAKAAKTLAKQLKAEVLGAQASGNACKVKLKMPAQNGKPSRIVTRTIKL